MRASPPIEVALNRFGVWRGALFVLVCATTSVIAAWIVLSREQQHVMVVIAAAVAAMAGVAMVAATASTEPVDLRWDGARWQLTPRDPGSGEPAIGHLTVAIDLGFWMLLRFVADVPEGRRRVTWLPVQRRGLEAQWHGLRCAVFSPQPAAGAA